MSKYIVTFSRSAEVEANNKDEAIDKAEEETQHGHYEIEVEELD